MSKRTPEPIEPAPLAPCHFCGAPSTEVVGIRPVCASCAVIVREQREVNLTVVLVALRQLASARMEQEQAA